MEENKTTWAILFSVLMVLWKGFVEVMVGLWKAFVEILSFPARAGVLFIILLIGFFIGKHFPSQDSKKEVVIATTEVTQPVKVVRRAPKMVVNDNTEAEQKAKVDLDEALKAKAEEDRRKTEEARIKTEAKAKAKAVAIAKVEVLASKTETVRETIIVDKKTAYFYSKDLKSRTFVLEEYYDDEGKFLKQVIKEPCKPFDKIFAKNSGKYMRLKLVSSDGYRSPLMTFTDENTPAAVVFENGEATVYRDLSVLQVDLVYPN